MISEYFPRLRAASAALAALSMAGCSTIGLHEQRLAKDEAPIPIGPAVRDNRTPMEGSLACFGDHLASRGGAGPVIAVGDVKDYTGKYSINEGNAITQGGALMVYSALGKIGRGLRIAERFDPVIAERELGYTDRRQLGDGKAYEVNGNRVPWVPYYGGSITRSDYYIVGGITELNYDVRSAGAEVAINNIGPKARAYTESVGVDLRIVDTCTLAVVRTVSLTKQFTGYEVGANVFRFFGLDLFDINLGAKAQEPLQLGIRTALEEATIRLVGAATGVDPKPCLGIKMTSVSAQTADELHERIPGFAAAAGEIPPAPLQAPTPVVPVGPLLNQSSGGPGGGTEKLLQVGFEFGDVTLTGASQATIDQIVALAAKGPVEFMLVARDTENWDPAKRDGLIDQRLAAIITALANRGIATAAIQVHWRPDRADTSTGRAAYDDTIQAACGLTSLQGGDEPRYVNTTIADKVTGLTLLYGILAALVRRERSGAGSVVEVPMFESMVSFVAAEHLAAATFDPPIDKAGYKRVLEPERRPYPTSDGHIAILPYSLEQWHTLFRVAGVEALARDERFVSDEAISVNFGALWLLLGTALSTRTTRHWEAVFNDADIPSMPVAKWDDVFDDPHLQEVDFFTVTDHPTEGRVRVPGNPVHFADAEQVVPMPAPAHGQHTREILQDLGYSDQDIRAISRP